ncbi:hypothetical protein [Pantanalinema sp. GBBB05]|uniref:hypothetical protein n=1 Tax=Pantanalinema sp. GBBB05 TaxID=2604139 RepID=UPI001D242CBE|nr:hypothetical protein [Pantanalinema sp. GBBB05]
MYSQVYYLVRSRADGSYLAARLDDRDATASDRQPPKQGYLLLFQEHFDALSYLNTHGGGTTDRFAVESIPMSQLESLLKRWDFSGIGIVQDPLIPKVEFLARS